MIRIKITLKDGKIVKVEQLMGGKSGQVVATLKKNESYFIEERRLNI